jgi:hypothetical protein
MRRLHALLVIRTLLIANGAILAAISGLYLTVGSKPGGWIVGGVLGAGALGLWAGVPFTDPYRSDRVHHHRSW